MKIINKNIDLEENKENTLVSLSHLKNEQFHRGTDLPAHEITKLKNSVGKAYMFR